MYGQNRKALGAVESKCSALADCAATGTSAGIPRCSWWRFPTAALAMRSPDLPPVDGQVLTIRVSIIHGSEGTAVLRLLYRKSNN